FFKAEDGIRDRNVTEFRRVLFRSYEHIGIENDDECTVVDLSDTTPPECGEAIGASTEWTKENREITMTCTDRNGCESVTKVFDRSEERRVGKEGRYEWKEDSEG